MLSTSPILPVPASDRINTSSKTPDVSGSTAPPNIQNLATQQPYEPSPVTDLEPPSGIPKEIEAELFLDERGNYGDSAPGTTALVTGLLILASTTTSTSVAPETSTEIPTGTDPEDIPSAHMSKKRPLISKSLDLISEIELNTNLLNVNAIPAEDI